MKVDGYWTILRRRVAQRSYKTSSIEALLRAVRIHQWSYWCGPGACLFTELGAMARAAREEVQSAPAPSRELVRLRRLLVPAIQDREDAWVARRRRCQTARLTTAKSKAKAKRLAAAGPARPQGRPRRELPPQEARPRGRRPRREEPPEEERRPRGRPRGEQAVPVEPRPRGRPRSEPVQEAQRPRGRPRLAPTAVQAAPSELGPSYDPRATLSGGSALAFSTLLKQSGLRRHQSWRQRRQQRHEEAGGEAALLSQRKGQQHPWALQRNRRLAPKKLLCKAILKFCIF